MKTNVNKYIKEALIHGDNKVLDFIWWELLDDSTFTALFYGLTFPSGPETKIPTQLNYSYFS